jgi:hypothetical protein
METLSALGTYLMKHYEILGQEATVATIRELNRTNPVIFLLNSRAQTQRGRRTVQLPRMVSALCQPPGPQEAELSLETTLWRGRAYAFLGLVEDTYGILPDYSSSDQKVLTSVMRDFVSDGQLVALEHCQPHKAMSGLPSWVWDWSQTYTQPAASKFITSFSATRSAVHDLHINRDVLRLRGLVVGRVRQAERAFPEFNPHEFRPGLVRTNTGESDFIPMEVGSKRTQEWVRRLSSMFKSLSNAAPRTMFETSLEGWVVYIPESAYEELLLNRMGIDGLSFEGRNYAAYLAIYVGSKSPFTTSNGLFGIGSSEEEQRIGDIVVLSLGATWPFIIREVEEGKFNLIGSVYVHGIMHGEFMDIARETTVFSLI